MNLHDDYKVIFSQIINGFSAFNHSFFNQVYLKHLTYLDLSNLDVKYSSFLAEAKKSGLSTYQQREKEILIEGFWTPANDSELAQNEKMIQDMKINVSKDYIHSRRQRMKKEIEESEKRIDALKIKKNYYIGRTAEQWANKKFMYHKIIKSFFKDEKCQDLLINDEISDENYDELVELYYEHDQQMNNDNIKKIALSPFFTNIFYLADDNVYAFYGKPIINLTVHQSNIVSYGRYFKHVLSEWGTNIPGEIRNDPEELLDWVEIRTAAKEAKVIGDENDKGGMGSIMGANKDDYRRLGIEVSDKNPLQDALKKSGGFLDKEKLFDMTS